MTKESIDKQKQAERLVEQHVLESINLTIEKELNENPELLYKAENYQKVKDELNEDLETEDEEPEIFEFWSVSDWLYDKLREKGEIVFECLDFYVWGRRTTGQALYLDDVIQEIAEEYNF